MNIHKFNNISFHFSQILQIQQVIGADENVPVEFVPQVSATCKAGVMNIKVSFNNPYSGAIHARDYRKRECMQLGNGSNSIGLSINLLAKQDQSDYCGVLTHNVSSEVRIQYSFFCFFVFF